MKGVSKISHSDKITKLSSYPRSVKFRPLDKLLEERKLKREHKIKLILDECDREITELNKSKEVN